MKEYYVVLRRLFGKEDCVSIYDAKEAIAKHWVDSNGNRIWVVPSDSELTATFVWGFDNLEQAFAFHDVLVNNEIGIVCKELASA